jgi:hypothetical protein
MMVADWSVSSNLGVAKLSSELAMNLLLLLSHI